MNKKKYQNVFKRQKKIHKIQTNKLFISKLKSKLMPKQIFEIEKVNVVFIIELNQFSSFPF